MREFLLDTALLQPAVALVCWTLVMWLWMYATRMPAIQRAKLDPAKIKRAPDLDALPMSVKQVADNYNHLHEQPTLFYALMLITTVAGTGSEWTLRLAWAYVVLRIVHSIYHALWNFVLVRFSLFVLASVPLFAIAIEQAIALFT